MYGKTAVMLIYTCHTVKAPPNYRKCDHPSAYGMSDLINYTVMIFEPR